MKKKKIQVQIHIIDYFSFFPPLRFEYIGTYILLVFMNKQLLSVRLQPSVLKHFPL